MFKKGETVKILDKEYIVTPCIGPKYTCRMCAEANIHGGGIPCIWNQQQCKKTLPSDCYLKPKQ